MNNEIENIGVFVQYAKQHQKIKNKAFQAIDFRAYDDLVLDRKFKNCIFLGCKLSPKAQKQLLKKGNMLFPTFKLPFQPYRSELYTAKTLYNNFDSKHPESYAKTTDAKVYQHYQKHGKGEPNSLKTALTRRLHDHAISDALYDYLEKWDSRKIVAIMGGHSLARGSEDYRKIVLTAKALAEKGHLMVSGGGPGGMEATHLGAWLAHRSEEEVHKAIDLLAAAPLYNDELWLSKAFEVMERYPRQTIVESVGIPTWFYGHEPPTPFATHIAKYFANSVREEGLLAIAKGGVIFAPGSAGTIQEIFQEAAQNHYETYGNVSPMVFLNTAYWTKEKPVFSLLQQLSEGKAYHDLVAIADQPEDIVAKICTFTEN